MAHRIVPKEKPGPRDREAILGPLSDFNARNGYPADGAPIALLLKDEKNRTVGGLWGRTGYGWLYVEFLSVPDALHGQGFGASLMRQAEAIAVERRCGGSWLTTFTFQARGFYEKLGYAMFAELEDSPAGNARIFMRKRLGAGAARSQPRPQPRPE